MNVLCHLISILTRIELTDRKLITLYFVLPVRVSGRRALFMTKHIHSSSAPVFASHMNPLNFSSSRGVLLLSPSPVVSPSHAKENLWSRARNFDYDDLRIHWCRADHSTPKHPIQVSKQPRDLSWLHTQSLQERDDPYGHRRSVRFRLLGYRALQIHEPVRGTLAETLTKTNRGPERSSGSLIHKHQVLFYVNLCGLLYCLY
jgi:hypothetical protein